MKELSILFIKGPHASARQYSLSYKAIYACGIFLIGAIISLSSLYYLQNREIGQQQHKITQQKQEKAQLQNEIEAFSDKEARIVFLRTYINELKKTTSVSESALKNHMTLFRANTAKLVGLHNYVCKIMGQNCSKEVINPEDALETIAWMEEVVTHFKELGDAVNDFNNKNLTNNEQEVLIKKLQIRISDTELELAENLEFLKSKERAMGELAKRIKSVTGLSFDVPKQFLTKASSSKNGRGGPSSEDLSLNFDVYPGESYLPEFLDETALYYETVVASVSDFSKSLEEDTILWQNTPTIRPLNSYKITDRFGPRIHPVTKKRDLHGGLDFSAKRGTKIYAPANGVVNFAKVLGTYGKFIDINHGTGFNKRGSRLLKVNTYTRYGHLSKILVKSGQKVKRGDIIGLVGSTGQSTGPHLHYEIVINKKRVDPYKLIKNYESLRFR